MKINIMKAKTERQREIKVLVEKKQKKLSNLNKKLEKKKSDKKLIDRARELSSEIITLKSEFDKIDKSINEAAEQTTFRSGGNQVPKIIKLKDYQKLSYAEKTEYYNVLSRSEKIATDEYREAFLTALWQPKSLTEHHKKFLQVGTNPAGNQDASPAVPTTTLNEVQRILKQTGTLAKRVRMSNISGDVKLPTQSGGTDAKWLAEGVEDDGNVTLAFVVWQKYEVVKNIELSKSAQFSTIDDFESFLVEDIAQEIAVAVEKSIADGDGTGKPTGILQTPQIPTFDFTGGANGLTYDNIVRFIYEIPTDYAAGAVIIASRETIADIEALKDANGQPINLFKPSDNIADGIRGYIKGFPVIASDYYPNHSDVAIASSFMTIGNLQNYRINFNQPLTIESDDSVGFKRRVRVWQGTAILDGKVSNTQAFLNAVKAA